MLSDDELPAMPDYLSPGTVHEYARAVERAAYERAVDACFEQSDDMASRDYNFAIDDCAAAIRALKKQR